MFSKCICFLISLLHLSAPIGALAASHQLPQPNSSPRAANIADLPRPLTIAHRGSSGTLPEHTLKAYRQAISDGADYIECDITLTRDLVPVCIHEVQLSRTTDVANISEFSNKQVMRMTPEGKMVLDWYSVDFDLVELKQLRKKQAYSMRDKSFDGMYDIPTFEEFLQVAAENPGIGIYPELKDAEWLNDLPIMNDTRFEDIVLGILSDHGYNSQDDLCYLQSFSEATLQYLTGKTTMKLVMLIDYEASDADLDRWRALGVYGIGVWTAAIAKHWNEENLYKNWITVTNDLVFRAHSKNLQVHVWTIRNEDQYLAWDFHQDVYQSIDHFLELRVDGFFSDFPGTLASYLDLLYANPPATSSAVRSMAERNWAFTFGCILSYLLGLYMYVSCSFLAIF